MRDRTCLIYVQHLLGTGHAVRAAALAREMARRGLAVTLVTGNSLPATLDVSGFDVRELPPARAADARFAGLVDPAGQALDEIWQTDRTERLLDLYEVIRPDILVTETFPLGRRKFAFELLPLLDKAGTSDPAPLIACSVRDILVRKTDPRKEAWMADIARAHYDLVLVHADPALVRLEDSFAYADRIADLVRYTGYVHEATGAAHPGPNDGTDKVIVSAGGGAVGLDLLQTALAARAHSRRAGDLTWRLLIGNAHTPAAFDSLRRAADDGFVVERVRPDFRALLSQARLSISQAGYNTALDVVEAGCAAVFVPFEDEGETEQRLRADLLHRRGLGQVVPQAEVTAARLAEAVDAALVHPRPDLQIRMNGAAVAADILCEMHETKRIKG
ncbi:MAG: glycosyltransferase [Pseudomonadota bacterium]